MERETTTATTKVNSKKRHTQRINVQIFNRRAKIVNILDKFVCLFIKMDFIHFVGGRIK